MWYAVIVAGVLVAALIIQYNKLVYLRQLVRNAWSDVDVYLKRRAELIPNLAASVKAYAQHENATFDKLAQARSQANTQSNSPARAQAESAIAEGLSRALMIAESYPELKANRNFLALQQELTETERLIANARQYYNACVRDYNTKIEAFPSNLVAPIARCRYAEFFEAGSVATLVPDVSLNDTQSEPTVRTNLASASPVQTEQGSDDQQQQV